MKLSLLIALSVFSTSVSANPMFQQAAERYNKFKAQEQRDQPSISSKRRPKDITPINYCEACMNIIANSLELLNGSRVHNDVFSAMSQICIKENYKNTVKSSVATDEERDAACGAFLMTYDRETLDFIKDRNGEHDIPNCQRILCGRGSKLYGN